MSTINELLVEIYDLKKKIEEEPRKKLKRKLLIEDEVEKLEQEKKRAGLKGDFSSVTAYNSKIKLLQQEKSTDKVFEYNENIKSINEEITNIIVDYYQEGYVIDDIFIKEDIPSHIQKEWLDKSDFGRNTGYLFVDEINEENYNWAYINPITDFEDKFINLKDLKAKMNKLNKIFFIFDSNLAEKSKNKDLIVIRKYIDDLILKLDDDESDKNKIFHALKDVAGIFDINQINGLSEFFMRDIENYSYFNEFNYILENCDGDFDNVYENLIDNAFNNLNDLDDYTEREVFDFFKNCADKFSKDQIMKYYNHVIENIDNFNELNFSGYYVKSNMGEYFNYILDCNKHKFGEKFIDNIYFNLIENGINKLKDNSGDVSAIFKYLKTFAFNFSKNQLDNLSDIVMTNNKIFNFAGDYKYILESNNESISGNVSSKIINNKIELISTLSDISNPINDLYYFSDDLDKKQFNRLCNIITENGEINNFALDFKKIVESCDFEVDKDAIYADLIDSRIEFLTKNDAQDISSNLFFDLLVFAVKFNQNQIKTFYQVCKQKEFINSFEDSIILILSKNEKQLDENFKLDLYGMKIDSKLNELEKLGFGYKTARDILEDLEDYSNYFSTPQLDRLCMISITNSQVYNCFICTNALRRILRENKDKINSELYEKAVLKNNL